jgi:nitroreductase
MSKSQYEAIRDLKAIRQTKPDELSEQDLNDILEVARWTGSSKNNQNWAFITVTGDQKTRLAEAGDFTVPLLAAPIAIAIAMAPMGYEFDIGKAAQNIMLAAQALGVASCPITLHREELAAATLDLPEGWRCRYAVTLGYPSDAATPANFGGRKPAEEVIFSERFGG